MTSQYDIERIAPAVKYEWDMFEWLSHKIERRIKREWQNVDKPTRNMLLEDFLLHARILRDFFVGEPRNDDVSARHFFDDHSAWVEEAKELCPYTRENKTRIDKKLAHLTYTRPILDKDWDFLAIRTDIYDAWDKFLSSLPSERRAWFQ